MPDLRLPGGKMKPVPAQWSNDPTLMPSAAQLSEMAKISAAPVQYFAEKAKTTYGEDAPETKLLAQIRDRKSMLESEQARLRSLFRRWDNLYYPDAVTIGGADHWPLSPEEASKSGKVHVSVNAHPVYVDVPAALQAVTPVENYVPAGPDEDEREAAGRRERLYFQWKEESGFELEVHKACIVKALYGFTFGKVYWDPIERRPTVTIIHQPENLYVGWGNSDFSRIDWTIYCYGQSPQAIKEDYGLTVFPEKVGDTYMPFVAETYGADHSDPIRTINSDRFEDRGARPQTQYEQLQVEVYDYWYKKPGKRRRGSRDPVKPEIWNAIFVGNRMVKNERHREYDEIPYVPLPNTFIPGLPYGRPELYDIEQLLREKDERITAAAQMIQSVVGGQMWQLVGPEAESEVPPNVVPKPNKVIAPGPGSEIRAIQPFVPQFAVEDFLKRLDLELEAVSGLNELLLGRAPATILGSSKAIAALVANYEARIQIKRQLLYQWRQRVWAMAAKVWERKSADVREIIDGNYRIEIKAPELTPRDELENAQKAINLVQNRIWSQERAMDATGVEDPIEEKEVIREEMTDPALNPQAVTQQATLLGTLQQLGISAPQQSMDQAQNAVRSLQRPAAGTSSLNGPENRGNPPPEARPANAQGGGAVLQTLVNSEGAQGRILTNTPLGGGESEAA